MDWEKYIDKHLVTEEKDGDTTLTDLQELFEMFANSNKKVILEKSENSGGKEITLKLPKMTPSEAWGVPSNESRKQITKIMNRVRGAGLKGKIEWLESFQKFNPSLASPGTIIANLIVLESLASIMNSFSSSSAGFVFEGFLAALLGGEQVSDPEDGSLPIEDIIAFSVSGSPVPMSVKLLTKGGTEIKGSYKNLIDALNKHASMPYILVYKLGDNKLSFNQFYIARENVVSMLYDAGFEELMAFNGKISTNKLIELERARQWEKLYKLLVKTDGYEARAQFKIAQGKMKNEPLASVVQMSHLGELSLDALTLKTTASQYMNKLGTTIVDLFNSVSLLSENLNEYFVNDNRGRAMNRGEAAVQNAKLIQKTTLKQIESEKKVKI